MSAGQHRLVRVMVRLLCAAVLGVQPIHAAVVPADVRLGVATGALNQEASLSVDLDGDGRADEVSVRADGSDITLRLSLAGSVASSFTHFASSAPGVSLSAYDIDGDGDCDVVVTGTVDHRAVAVWENRGEGQFELHRFGLFGPVDDLTDRPGSDSSAPIALPPPAPGPSGATRESTVSLAGPPSFTVRRLLSGLARGLPEPMRLARLQTRGPPFA